MYTVYKVAMKVAMYKRTGPTRFYSATLSTFSSYCLDYEIDKETVAKEGTAGVFCFTDTADAKEFGLWAANEWISSWAILQCDTEHQPQPCRYIILGGHRNDFSHYWELIKESDPYTRGLHHPWGKAPAGTHVVPSLTPRAVWYSTS